MRVWHVSFYIICGIHMTTTLLMYGFGMCCGALLVSYIWLQPCWCMGLVCVVVHYLYHTYDFTPDDVWAWYVLWCITCIIHMTTPMMMYGFSMCCGALLVSYIWLHLWWCMVLVCVVVHNLYHTYDYTSDDVWVWYVLWCITCSIHMTTPMMMYGFGMCCGALFVSYILLHPFIKATFSFHKLIPKNAQMTTVYTNWLLYITFTMIYYIRQE